MYKVFGILATAVLILVPAGLYAQSPEATWEAWVDRAQEGWTYTRGDRSFTFTFRDRTPQTRDEGDWTFRAFAVEVPEFLDIQRVRVRALNHPETSWFNLSPLQDPERHGTNTVCCPAFFAASWLKDPAHPELMMITFANHRQHYHRDVQIEVTATIPDPEWRLYVLQ